MGALVLMAVGAGLSGCNPLLECRPRLEVVVNAEGQEYRCTASEDCPRSSRESVCVTDVNPAEECVRCVDTRCVRMAPEVCS
jgi:hypothetical protein